MKLVVGLGNPGKEYARNRHNVGFRCVDYLARHGAIQLKVRRHHSRLGSGRIDNTEVLLAKPQTFVNRSGEAVSQLAQQYRIAVGDLIVISDDLDLPLGKLRIRAGGSSGGHKGLKSIASALGATDFLRLRIGIGRPEDSLLEREMQVVNHVLGDFTPDEEQQVALVIPRAAEAIRCLLTDGVSAAMARTN
ncbi:MAG: aminoacyl-tRNA hydrolase [Chloroflexota bacterium]